MRKRGEYERPACVASGGVPRPPAGPAAYVRIAASGMKLFKGEATPVLRVAWIHATLGKKKHKAPTARRPSPVNWTLNWIETIP